MRPFTIAFLFINSYLAFGQIVDKSEFDRLVIIPWESDNTTYKNYNPKVSELVGQLLPTDIISNKRTLNPTLEEFEQGILMRLSFKVNFVNRKEFKKLLKKKSR